MTSSEQAVRLQEYGIESLHVLVESLPVAATVLLLLIEGWVGGVIVECNICDASEVEILLLFTVRVTVTVPVTVAATGSSASSSTAGGSGRNAPVRGSR